MGQPRTGPLNAAPLTVLNNIELAPAQLPTTEDGRRRTGRLEAESLLGSLGGRAKGGADSLPGVSVRAGSPDGGFQFGLGLRGSRPGSGDPAEICGSPVGVRCRAEAKERAIHPERRGQVLDVQDVAFFGPALYVGGEDGGSRWFAVALGGAPVQIPVQAAAG